MVTPTTPTSILDLAFQYASNHLTQLLISNIDIARNIEYICRYQGNRACTRFILACSLAKTYAPQIDIRKPYTEIGDADAYSGRTYDEAFIGSFVAKHNLPCNPTTAFLTPAFRNRNITLTPEINMVGRPPKLYQTTLQLLTDIYDGKVAAQDVLTETIRWLLVIRDEQLMRLETLLANLRSSEDSTPLASEAIVTLIEQHLKCPNSSRLPVLAIAAIYQTIRQHLGEQILPLETHNAADEQTGALGDIQVTLLDEEQIITVYEMKARRVEQYDIDLALQKLNQKIDNYIFITTEPISDTVRDYAASTYGKTGGIEIVVLDCIGFLRHFLHLFHRSRMQFLESYQQLVLTEPESAVRPQLKEAFLALRLAAESANALEEDNTEKF